MTTVPDTTPRAMRIDGALSARAVLDHFNEKGRGLLGIGQEDAAARMVSITSSPVWPLSRRKSTISRSGRISFCAAAAPAQSAAAP